MADNAEQNVIHLDASVVNVVTVLGLGLCIDYGLLVVSRFREELRAMLEGAPLHELTDKPVLVSEFYMAAEENRSGNKNTVGVFPQVETQKERGKALANTLAALARLPYVVGADWFQYYDEPPHGRQLDGEDPGDAVGSTQ